MTSAKAIEYRITRDLAVRRDRASEARVQPIAGQLIVAVALSAGMLVFGSLVPELLAALIAGALLAALGR